MLERTYADRQYHQNLEVGEAVSTLLHVNEHMAQESFSNEYKNTTWKPW